MKPNRERRPTLWGAVALTSLGVLWPSSGRAQAGLSGSALDGQYEEMRGIQKFDQGFQSKSALGQLEELSGGKVDRSSSSSPQYTKPKVSKPHFDANQAFRTELAGAVAGLLFESLFSDDSAKKRAQAEAAAKAAAAAAAQAEAFRIQQENERKARILRAHRYRADWDARDAETDRQLNGAFDVSTGTAFFGRPTRIDPAIAALLGRGDGLPSDADGDPSAVDLRGSSLVVRPSPSPIPAAADTAALRPGLRTPTWFSEDSGEEPSRSDSDTMRQIRDLGAYFGPVLEKWYSETVIEGTAKATLWGFAKNVPGQPYAKALYDFNEQRKGLVEDVGDAYERILERGLGDSGGLVRALAAPGGGGDYAHSYWEDLAQRDASARVEFYRLAIGQGFSKAELDLGETGLLGEGD